MLRLSFSSTQQGVNVCIVLGHTKPKHNLHLCFGLPKHIYIFNHLYYMIKNGKILIRGIGLKGRH